MKKDEVNTYDKLQKFVVGHTRPVKGRKKDERIVSTVVAHSKKESFHIGIKNKKSKDCICIHIGEYKGEKTEPFVVTESTANSLIKPEVSYG